MVDKQDTDQHELEPASAEASAGKHESTPIGDAVPVVDDTAQADPAVDDSSTQTDPVADVAQPVQTDDEATDEVAEQIPQPEFEPEAPTSADTVNADVAEEAADQQVSGSAEPVTQPAGEPENTDTPTLADTADTADTPLADTDDQNPNAKWYVVHTFSGHENKVATNLKQRIESEHLENKIIDILVPTQDKIEIRGGKKEQVKEKIFPGYILVKMELDDASWLAVRTTQGVTAFVGMNNKPTPISQREVSSIVKFMTQGAPATFKDVFMVDDTVKIIDGPFTDFIGKVDSVDKEKGKVRILVSIFGRETPVELDFLQVTKL